MSSGDWIAWIITIIASAIGGFAIGVSFGWEAGADEKHRESHGDKDDKPEP